MPGLLKAWVYECFGCGYHLRSLPTLEGSLISHLINVLAPQSHSPLLTLRLALPDFSYDRNQQWFGSQIRWAIPDRTSVPDEPTNPTFLSFVPEFLHDLFSTQPLFPCLATSDVLLLCVFRFILLYLFYHCRAFCFAFSSVVF